jgi:hypothetical protein
MDKSFVNVEEAIATAESFLPEGISLTRPFARQWAYLALRDIGPGDHWFEECWLYPNENLNMRKPDNMWKPIDIALYDSSGNELKFVYRGLGHRKHRLDRVDLQPYIDLSEDTHCFILGSNGTSVNKAFLQYWRLPIDEDGTPLVPESQVLAIAFFIYWMWEKKQRTNQSAIAQARQDYLEARREARNRSKMPSGIAFEQAAKEWTSMLNSPQFKQF